MKTVFTKSIVEEKESDELARYVVETYLKPHPGFCIFLEGGLGAGKTYLVRAMLRALGVEESIVSPTYGLVHNYRIDGFEGAHFDFYRLEDPHDFFARGFVEIAEDASVGCFVEWPDKISKASKSCFTGPRLHLQIELGVAPQMRRITLSIDD